MMYGAAAVGSTWLMMLNAFCAGAALYVWRAAGGVTSTLPCTVTALFAALTV